MKHIVILAGDTVMTSQLVGVMDFFMICNKYWQIRTRDPKVQLFKVTVASPDGSDLTSESGVTIPASFAPDLARVDTIIVTAGVAYDKPTLGRYYERVRAFSQYLHEANVRQVPIGGFCSATFVLAQMGLLKDRKATTVWWLADLFRQSFPATKVELKQLVVRDGNLFTAGASTSYLSLCLSMLEHLYDAQIANQVAKIMLVDPNRNSQLPYMSLQTPESHKDDLVHSIQHWMYKNLSRHISLDDISERFAITKRTLNRRFKKALDDTPVNYLQRMRVEEAKKLLESSDMTVESIVYQVGYEDVSSFRKLFTEIAEVTPKAYREKFQAC